MHIRSELIPFVTVLITVWITARYCSVTPVQWHHPQDKLILVWVPFFQDPFFYFGGGGKKAFEAAGCEVTACELVPDKRYLMPMERYDAVMFHGFEYYTHLFGTPSVRTPEQLYVYMNLEPELNSKIPSFRRDYYNLTITYRLDSDIPWPYFAIADKWSQEDVAPAISPFWDDVYTPEVHSEDVKEIKELVRGKERPAAWIASNCHSDSYREEFVEQLRVHGVEVDAYGKCGTLTCVRNEKEDCRKTIGRKYYFYLVFENSFCFDYVTEKMVTAMGGGAVPVVLSGVNLTRFLPPGSYLDARKLGPKATALEMKRLMNDKVAYEKYLWWRTRYRVERRDPGFKWPLGQHPLCKLCGILHGQPYKKKRKKNEVQNWWSTKPEDDTPACFLEDVINVK